MRKLILLAVVAMVSTATFAQNSKMSLSLHGGYTFKDRVKQDASYIDVMDAFQYGGSLEYFTSKRQSLELSYLRMGTSFPFYGPAGQKLNEGNVDGSLNYILFGGNSYFPKTSDAKKVPFIGGGLGVGIVNYGGHSTTNFGWNFKAGVKVNSSDAVSVKLQAYVQSIMGTFGNDYWYAGGGVVYSVPDYAAIFQFGLGATIDLKLGGKK